MSDQIDISLISTRADGTGGIGMYTDDLKSYISSHEKTGEISSIYLPANEMALGSFVSSAIQGGISEQDILHIQHEYSIFGPASLYSWFFFPILFICTRLTGTPIVLTMHETLTAENIDTPPRRTKSVYLKLLNQLLIQTSDHIIFLSEHARDRFLTNCHVPSYEVVQHGSKTDETIDMPQSEARNELGYNDDDVLIIEPGYVVPRKGSHIFVELAKQLPEYEFMLVGGKRTNQSEYYERIISDAGENLTVTGVLDEFDYYKAFRAADVVVLPYIRTNQSGVVNKVNQSGVFNQCAAYGLPVAASDIPYFHKLSEQWGCVALFDPQDMTDILETVQNVVEDKATQRGLQKAILRYSEENSFSDAAKRHVETYQELLSGSI
ncbi:glycosyltransferase family 4 protein [Halorubrum halophilum]|uniref:glycosyltransferase family 4 protein n=1 Tax=Halorubrum halophilum TaxID=413816 RepID=UPI00186ADCF8|nr:glycosyltransferase family 4 protein [Halorubrum halophilum]